MQEIQISFAGGILSANLFPAPEGGYAQKPAALLIHGWQSGQDRMFDSAEMLSKKSGTTCLTFDLRAHGKSSGNLDKLSSRDFLDDVIAAYDFLASQLNVDKNRIGVIGSSFGGYLAVLLSSKRKIAWIVLRVPADYPDDRFSTPKISNSMQEMTRQAWLDQKKDWGATAALRAIHNFMGKVLIVESEKDELIPHQTIENYINAVADKANLQYKVMKDAPHSLSKHPELKKQFNDVVFEWDRNKSNFAHTTVF